MANKRFHKGDQVEFSYGTRMVRGVITEDRGTIGVGGRRLYSIEFRSDPYAEAPSVIELPADEFQLAKTAIASK